MRTSSLLPAMVLILAAPASFAHDEHREQDPWYLQMAIGAVLANAVDSPLGGEVGYDPGFSGSLALGRDMGKFFTDSIGWALEVEGIYNSFRVSEEDLIPFGTKEDGATELAWMGNLIFDLHFNRSLALYFGGGLGWASSINFDTFDTGNFTQLDNDGLAYQLKGGFKWHLGGLIEFLMGYRFMGTEDLQVRNNITLGTFDLENTKHIFELGFRWGI